MKLLPGLAELHGDELFTYLQAAEVDGMMALALVDVRVVGRIILDDRWFYSFAPRGLL